MKNTENIRATVEKILGTNYEKTAEVAQVIEDVIAEADAYVASKPHNPYAKSVASTNIASSWFKRMSALFGREPVTVNGREISFVSQACLTGIDELRFYAQQLFADPDMHETASELRKLATERGYKQGWVWYRLSEKYGKIVTELL